MLTSFEIGKQLPLSHPGREGVIFQYTESGPIMIIAFKRPRENEIKTIQSGDVQMALYTTPSIIFILSKFGSLNWMDAPYSVRLHDNLILDWREQIAEGEGIALQIVLIDADSKIIKAQRMIGCATNFSQEMRKEIERQFEGTFSKEEYKQKLSDIYTRLTTDDMVHRSIAHFRIRREP